MKKYLFLLLNVIMLSYSSAQVFNGTVLDNEGMPLLGVTILEIGTLNGTTTDQKGFFELIPKGQNAMFEVSFLGFKTDTIRKVSQNIAIRMEPENAELSEVIVQTKSAFIDDLQAQQVEIITEMELTKAACCNLSESFETNASVDVSYTDAVSGTKTIQMLGLAGRFVQINRENIPHIRGLMSNQGLSYVPGPWIQSIDVGKGAGSVVNGFESMSGQINVEFKKTEIGEKLYLNAYANSFSRVEANTFSRILLSEKWSTSLLMHADFIHSEIDQNHDGFMDLPKGRQLNVMNRYKYRSDKLVSQIGFQVMSDEKVGGQTGFDFNEDALISTQYGFVNRTKRYEFFGKTGLLFPHKPYKGWGFIYSASLLDREMFFGRGTHLGEHISGYGNTIYQNIIEKNSFHAYKTGVSILLDDFRENFRDTVINRHEVTSGTYFEYTYSPKDKLTLILGNRIDNSSLFGVFFTPRIHFRYQWSEKTNFRLAAGKGYRTPNLIAENIKFLFSSRQWQFREQIRQEASWNFGGSTTTAVLVADKNLNFVADYFYSTFQNQLIVDLDSNPSRVSLYNLKGRSFAHSFQFEISYPLSERLSAKAAYKYYDVQATVNEKLREVPFNARDRLFFNMAYATKFDKWTADFTWVWNGPKRLPDTEASSSEFRQPAYSSSFSRVNAQMSRGFRWGSIYLGGENLLNFRQDNPIIDPENPFSSNFDASFVWGPIAGRMIYIGFRYKIKDG